MRSVLRLGGSVVPRDRLAAKGLLIAHNFNKYLIINFPFFHLAKYLTVRSSGCDSVRFEGCNYFCVTCLTQAQRNPLECPSHGPAEPLIGTVNYSIVYRRSSHTIILTTGL